MARRLKPRQYEAARLVAEGHTDVEITRQLRLRRFTLSRWRRLPEFYAAVLQHVENTASAARFKLHQLRLVSVKQLESRVSDIYSSPAERKQLLELLEYCRTLPADVAEARPQQPESAPDAPESAPG